ncbi:WAT1-related protein At3g18200 [Selaginella moellendorffii]|uniref:WAT1-related protein At3g18200 n=1 Tax=Selaginella moellendorffii TaxID=88036 RepID=UPI000D1CABBD|nr:WAT1-related protein At3g18200 [Selaginella moellendorffii]|eukprot:XP_024542869.1 WAT1-related protein At3g18200 [Selaginella moellendorffii]
MAVVSTTPQELRIDINDQRSMNNDNSSLQNCAGKLRLYLSLGATQALFAGFEVLSRVALDQGVGKTAFTFYRNCLATIVLGIFGIIFERKNWRKLTSKEVFYFFFLGFLGVTMNQLCYLVGLGLTSVMVTSAIRNCIPIMTFVLACFFKLEKVDLRQRHGIAKLSGALIGLVGSIILSIYKGPVVLEGKFAVFRTKDDQGSSAIVSNIVERHVLYFFTGELHYKMVSWHLGAIFLLLSGLSFALFLILQAPVLKSFPAPVTFASMSCLSSVIQLPVVGAAFEPQWSLWTNIKLGEALSIVYAGVIGSGIVSGIQSWAVKEGGPVVVAAYQPLETIITACLSYFFLKESLRLGTLVGGLTIIFGLYLLIWGQRKEREANEEVTRKATEITLVLQPSRRASFIKPVQVFDVEQRGI